MRVSPLTVNQLTPPADFPRESFERCYKRVLTRQKAQTALVQHFAGAWNAVSIRFATMCQEGAAFTDSISAADAHSSFEQRYRQERHLFGLFSNSVSIFEAFFYGMFAVGAILEPYKFPITSQKDQQRVSPDSTITQYKAAFAGDPLISVMEDVIGTGAYGDIKIVRNVLTHRTAPGRVIYAGLDDVGETAPPTWKIQNVIKPIDIDLGTAADRRADTAKLLASLLDASAIFIEARVG